MKHLKYPTIKDVAKRAEVSVSTVSRVLNEKPDISEKTKNRVLKAMERVGYVPNRAASIIRDKLSQMVGMIFDCSNNPFILEVLESVQRAANKYNYQLLLMNTEFKPELEKKSIKILLEHRVDGLLYFPTVEKSENLRWLLKRKFPVVVVGRDVEDLPVDCVYTNDTLGGYVATKHLIETGRRKLLMINADTKNNAAAQLRQEGFLKAIAESETLIEHKCIANSRMDAERAFRIISDVYSSGESKYDGILCFNDIVAFGAMNGLFQRGFKIPEDVAVVGYDDTAFSSMYHPQLTTVKIDSAKEGMEAFKLLIARINEPDKPPVKKVLDIQLVVRNSTKL